MRKFDVIIIGGRYSGLAAAMGLGRALRSVLVIDSGKPANRYTLHSHNFLTNDGRTPAEIIAIAKAQVDHYDSVKRIEGDAVNVERIDDRFQVTLADQTKHFASKLVFATGIIDVLPDIAGITECWGKSVLHCPYCHGYEVRNTKTGILGNGDYAFEFGSLISNWTSDLTIYTNGQSTLTHEQTSKLLAHNIKIVTDKIKLLKNDGGHLENILFANGVRTDVNVLYTRPPFKQHCDLLQLLGCEMTADGYIKVDGAQRTTVTGVYACGDNVSKLRTVANAVSMGTATAMSLNKDMIIESFR
ncbi:MAG: NAD(P)/FAD-dependent oxidoreductase [Bacteroidota bacterium]